MLGTVSENNLLFLSNKIKHLVGNQALIHETNIKIQRETSKQRKMENKDDLLLVAFITQ